VFGSNGAGVREPRTAGVALPRSDGITRCLVGSSQEFLWRRLMSHRHVLKAELVEACSNRMC
jgi:hypothetical protein